MRTIVFLVIIYSIASILFSWWHFASYRKVQLEAHQNQQLLVARNTINKIDRFLFNQHLLLELTANHISDHEAENVKNIEKILKELSLKSGTWEAIVYVNPDGKVISSTLSNLLSKSIIIDGEVAAELRRVNEGSQGYTSFFQSKLLNKPTQVFLFPVRDEKRDNHPLTGAIIGYLTWPALEETLDQLDSPGLVVNGEGNLIASNSKVKDQNRYDIGQKIVEPTYLNDKEGSRSIDGVKSLFGKTSYQTIVPQQGFANFKGSGWYLISEKSVTELYGDSNRNLLFETVIFTLILFVILFIITLFAGIVEKKIRRRFSKKEMMEV